MEQPRCSSFKREKNTAMVGPRWGLVAAAAVALLPSLGADPAPYATPYARLVGKSKIELARSMHGVAMLHRDAPKASASCRRVGLSLDGQTIRDQNRSILIMVQTMTASKSNLCEGSRADWRDGQGRKRGIQRRFNVSVPRARVSETAPTLRERSER